MLNHPSAIEGRALYAMLYPNDNGPPGLAGRLRAKGYRLMRSTDPLRFQAGVLLHGIAEAAEARLQKAVRRG